MKIKFSIFLIIFFLSFNVNAEQKEIETIIANGMGTSIQDAAQNAAENALTQAVGSFIDATTLMEKHTVITDGIVSKSKSINKDIKEYSQGSIQYFEILKTKQTSGIFRLTARVDVRIEDFRAYIKELASGTQEISGGLFAQMKTEQDNTADRISLVIDKILMPIMAGEVHDIEIQAPMPLKRFIEICPSIEEEMFFGLGSRSRFAKSAMYECNKLPRKNKSEIVVFPFSISLKDEFFENMTNIFDNISNSKKEHHNTKARFNFDRDSFNVVINNKGHGASSAITYVIDDFWNDAQTYLKNKFKNDARYIEPETCAWYNNLIFKIFDANSKVIKTVEMQTCRGSNALRAGMGDEPLLSLYAANQKARLILSKRYYYLLVRISPDVLEKAASVEISYVQN